MCQPTSCRITDRPAVFCLADGIRLSRRDSLGDAKPDSTFRAGRHSNPPVRFRGTCPLHSRQSLECDDH